MEINIYDYV
jgi:hypothetical protein